MRDEDFIRGDIPMTKSEIRAVSLSKLDLKAGDIFYDIGAGTGSVSVEASGYVPDGWVYAFEEKEEACALIGENAEKFGVRNISIVRGHAPETFASLPAPDCAFIGGSKGCMDSMIKALTDKNPQVRIVINVVTLETLCDVMNVLSELSLRAEIVCVSVSRAEKAGKYHIMKGQNPVYIITAKGCKNG